MPSPPHLQIFNPGVAVDEKSDFKLFSSLPKELRLKIWRHSLHRERIIKVELRGPLYHAAALTDIPEVLGSTSNNEGYCAFVDGYEVLSKLLRVNNEARVAALEFYRVHFPCTLTKGGGGIGDETMKAGILYFNPEYDFLLIHSYPPAKDTLFDFVYHLKNTYDPLHVGLLNLAVDINSLNGNDLHEIVPSSLEPKVRTAFVETITQLREVFFVSRVHCGRQILSLMSYQMTGTSEAFLNRSFPIITRTPTFERLPRDPRAIDQDLKHVFVEMDNHILRLWENLLEKFAVSAPQIEYRVFLGFVSSTTDSTVYDRESAKVWLQTEDDMWTGANRKVAFEDIATHESIKWPVGAETAKYKNEDLDNAVKPAFGFWLFPIDALSSEPRGQNRLQDLSAHFPELALSSLQ